MSESDAVPAGLVVAIPALLQVAHANPDANAIGSPPRSCADPGGPWQPPSDLLVGRHVPAADDFAAERAVRLLFLVLELNLGVVDRDLIHGNDVRAGRAGGVDRADQDRRKDDRQKLLL